MNPVFINLAYLVAGVLFIFGLKGLTHPRTAVRGNFLGAMAMLVAVVATLLQQGVQVQLPKASAQAVTSDQALPVIVSVNKDGEYFLSHDEYKNEPVTADRLRILVKAIITHKPGTKVLVNGDRSVSYGRVVKAMALLQASGVPQVGLLTESPE